MFYRNADVHELKIWYLFSDQHVGEFMPTCTSFSYLLLQLENNARKTITTFICPKYLSECSNPKLAIFSLGALVFLLSPDKLNQFSKLNQPQRSFSHF